MLRETLKIIPAAATFLLATPSSAASPAQAETAMFRGGPALTGVYHGPAPRTLQGVAFTVRTDGPIRGTPALSGGTLYFGSADHRLYAVDAADGREYWRFTAGGQINSSPAVAGGLVFFTSRDGYLHALSAASGRERWRFRFGADLGTQNYWDFYTSSPVIAAGKLYVGSGDGHLYAIDPGSGRRLWSFDAGSRIRSTPAIAAGVVAFGSMSGHVFAVDAETGRLKWKYATEGAGHRFGDKGNDTTSIFGSPSISAGVVTVGGRDGFLYAIDLASGRVLWHETHDGGSWVLSTAIDGGSVYSGSGSAFFLQSSDLRTGHENWRFKTAGAIFGSPSIVGGVVLIDDLSGLLHAVDETSGRELWHFAMPDRSLSTPIAGGGLVYASSDDGILYALRTTTAVPGTAARRIVYREGMKSKDAFSWFQHDIDLAILRYFRDAGYEQVDAAGLRAAMEAQLGGGRSIIVFSDNKVPAELAGAEAGQSPLRRYLDAGGRAVFLGNDPLAFVTNPATGEASGIDYDIVERVLGIRYPPPNRGVGYHVSEATAEGATWGLPRFLVANNSVEPPQVTTVLASDEFGMATAWDRSYGSAGGDLLQLALPRNRVVDLSPYQNVIEHRLR